MRVGRHHIDVTGIVLTEGKDIAVEAVHVGDVDVFHRPLAAIVDAGEELAVANGELLGPVTKEVDAVPICMATAIDITARDREALAVVGDVAVVVLHDRHDIAGRVAVLGMVVGLRVVEAMGRLPSRANHGWCRPRPA